MLTDNLKLSKILSYILHPLLIPTAATVALLLYPDVNVVLMPFRLKAWFLSVVFVFTFILPVAVAFILIKFKVLSSINMSDRRERTVPLIITSTSFMALLFSIKSTGIPPVFLYVLYTATISIISGLLINTFYKISLHTLGWGALVAAFIGLSLRLGNPMVGLIVTTIVLSGIAGYARLDQNAHNQAQIYLGYIAGAGVITLVLMLQ
jgi:hypothetical protein